MDLKIQDLSFGYKKNNLLKSINLSVSSGEVIALVGQNGCGKTTLLKIISGFLREDSGHIIIDNKEVIKDKIYSGIIETPAFWNHMTGNENLLYYLEKDYSKEKIDEYADKFDLSHMLDKTVKDYSLGMKQKLGLILSFVSDSPIMLFDEPTNSLDQPSVGVFFECVMNAKRNGKIVIITTHIVYELDKYCDSIYLIKEGKLLKYCPSCEEFVITYATDKGALSASKMISDSDVIKIDNSSIYIRPASKTISDIVRETSSVDIIGVRQEPLTFDKICDKARKIEGGV